nr:hypothetical protein [uncultured Pseudomonas sp.]
MSVSELGRKGLTASTHAATEKLHTELNEALDRAQAAGLAVELVVGMLELTKAAVLESYFRQMEDIHGE